MARTKNPGLSKVNRTRIVSVAKALFLAYGIENTKIDDIAKEVGMSKSTLYVYFRGKEDIIDEISLEAMKYLYEELQKNIPDLNASLHEKFMNVCEVIVAFKEKYPLSFQLLIDEINVEDTCIKKNLVLKEIYETGENINQFIIRAMLNETKESKQESMPTIFAQWGSIYGLIELADNKEKYIQKSMHMTKNEFLKQGFEQLYRALE